MSGFGITGFENAQGGGGALDYVKDAFTDISVPASSNAGFSTSVLKNPLQNYYADDDSPRWAAKTLWIKALELEENRTLWVSSRPTYNIVWQEDFIAAKGYVFGSVGPVSSSSGTYVDLQRIGDGIGVGGVIRRVQWIVDSRIAATSTAQLKLDGANTTTIDFSSDVQDWTGQPKFNAYTSNTSNETRDIHDYQLVALQAGNLRVTGCVVYYEITGGAIDCFGGSSYIDKQKVTTVGSSLALPSVANFRGGRGVAYKTVTADYGFTTTLVTDISTVATGSSGTNLLSVQTGTGASFLAGTVVWGALNSTHYIGNVLSVSGDVLTMGVTLPQGLSAGIYQVWQAGHTFSVNRALSLVDFAFDPFSQSPVVGSSAPSGVLAFESPTLKYRVWGGTLQVIPGASLSTTLGITYGIDLSHANSFLQVDGKYQSLEFEFLAGASGYIQATFGIDGLRCFNINEAFSGPGIFRKVIAVDAGPGWHSVVMNRGVSYQQILVSQITGYRSSSVYNGPSFGQLATLDFGQTFLQRDSVNATLTALGNVQRIYADSLYAKGSWTRGTTTTSAGGVHVIGTAAATTRLQYYGSALALVGAAGTSCAVTIDGLTQGSTFGTWLGTSLATDFHTLSLTCNTGNTRVEAIDLLLPGQITNIQKFGMSAYSQSLLDHTTADGVRTGLGFSGPGGTVSKELLAPSALYKSVQSKTTNYTALSTDDSLLMDATAGNLTVTLFATALKSGKTISIKKTDATFNTVTIDANASETIDGAATLVISTQYESVVLVSDGANWSVLSREVPSNWTAYTMTITGSVSNPTKGTTSKDLAVWRREGDSVRCRYFYAQTGAGSAGSGVYLFAIPTGLTMDTSKFDTTAGQNRGVCGTGALGTSSLAYSAYVLFGTTTKVSVKFVPTDQASGTITDLSSSSLPLSGTDVVVCIDWLVPVTGWTS